jgi:hypothetical protein
LGRFNEESGKKTIENINESVKNLSKSEDITGLEEPTSLPKKRFTIRK